DAGNEDDQSRALDAPEAPELEDDGALVLAQDAQRAGHEQQQDDEHDRAGNHRGTPWVAGASATVLTSRVRPSTRVTRTRSPVRSGSAARTLQRSPSTSAQASWPTHSITSPEAPIMCGAPLTTGRRRALAAM